MNPFYEMDGYYLKRNRDKKKIFESNYWDVVVDPDGKQRNRLEERERKLSDLRGELTYINSLPGGNFLDFGCGLGFTLSGVGDQWNRYGLEMSEFAGDHAKKWGDIHIGTVQEANYASEFFDAILMYHVIEHLEKPEQEIKEIHRILKPGAKFIISTPDFDSACARRFKENYRMLISTS